MTALIFRHISFPYTILSFVALCTMFCSCGSNGEGPAKPIEVVEKELISTLPTFVVDDATDIVVTISTEGSALEDFAGDIYAHTGVLTNLSNSSSDWKYVPFGWSVNNDKCKMRRADKNTYTMTITGGARSFYGVPSTEQILSLAFVFRSADGSKELKNNGNDIFVELAQPGLDVRICSPENRAIWLNNAVYTLKVASKDASFVALYASTTESEPLAQTSTNADIAYRFTTTAYEDLCFIAVAANGTETVRDTLFATVLSPTVSQARPSGATDGVSVDGTSATFVLYAPQKESVVLLGDFNSFAVTNLYQMKRDGDYFWTRVEGLQSGKEYAYQYLVDGQVRVADPYCTKILDPWNDKYISAATYPSLRNYPVNQTTGIVSTFTVDESEYGWSSATYTRPRQRTLAVYELLIRDFTTEGTISAVTARLDYLQELGINAVELMPVQEFDGNDSWGYNPCFYFAPDKVYGTPDDYKHFIDECHSRGIAVILDVVFNHATGQFPWAKMWAGQDGSVSDANPFFNKVAKHPYNVFNDFNHEYAKTRSYFKDVLRYWLEEYHIDGFRFDLSKGFTQNASGSDVGKWGNYDASRIAIIKDYADAIRAVDPTAYIILEHFAQDREENELASYRDIMLWRNAVSGYSETVMGWPTNSNFASVSAAGRMGYIESHDEERVAYKAKTYGQSFVKNDLQRIVDHLIGAYALHFLSPESKMMWQMGELGYDYSIDYNDRTGRKPVKWDYLDVAERKQLHDAVGKIISFRTSHSAMYNATTAPQKWAVAAGNMAAKTLVYSTSAGSVVVVANFTSAESPVSCTLPEAGVWRNLLDNTTVDISGGVLTDTLSAGKCLVLVKE